MVAFRQNHWRAWGITNVPNPNIAIVTSCSDVASVWTERGADQAARVFELVQATTGRGIVKMSHPTPSGGQHLAVVRAQRGMKHNRAAGYFGSEPMSRAPIPN